MGFFSSFNISASGMTSQRLRMDLIANNLANVNTTRTRDGGPYQRQVPLFGSRDTAAHFPAFLAGWQRNEGGGVRVVGIVKDPAPPRLVYDPEHPDAGEDGYVAYPNVNVVMEMTDLIAASRAYEANVTAFNAAKTMASLALEIGR
ncbi:MAG TPA: flagellar basal body rod protein FlgC [Firmicutes bacterium]|nr:flagellar basal body rod protein FlgC [Bacillota bacterium]